MSNQRFIGRVFRHATRGYGAVLAVLGLSSLLVAHDAWAANVDIKDFPLAIYCESSGIEHVFYLSKLQKDGLAVYARPDGVIGTISFEGTAKVVGGDGESGSCGGKTIIELREAGQTFDFRD